MKNKLVKILSLISILFIFSSSNHPIKLTASLIEYNPEANSIRMECRVFIDDFEDSIHKKGFDVLNLTEEDKEEIEYFFDTYYHIKVNGKKLPLNYKSSEIIKDHNVLVIKFTENDITIKNGDQLFIENKLFFEQFGYLQSNRITLRIPPFFKEKNYAVNLAKYSISLNI